MKRIACLLLLLFTALTLPVSAREAGSVDLVVFSYNRPMQLYALLESSEKYFTGLNQLHVIYRSGSASFDEGYQVVKQRFPRVKYHKQSTTPTADFKSLVLSCVYGQKTSAPYVLFAVDDIIVTDKVDLRVCTKAIEQYKAWGFYLRMGKNIKECYSLNQSTPCPKGRNRVGKFFQWSYRDGQGDWRYPNSVDMTVYRKSRIESFLRTGDYIHPPTLEARWAEVGDKKLYRKGISFLTSKMINIPLNSLGPYNNRHMHSFTPEELQEKFKSGKKIDISRYYRMRNRAPHVDCELTFISR